ncbi:NADH pyrophosphatase [uncultured archaeon]|nr:NADH pyrophosphatase [uncultured archaeon]
MIDKYGKIISTLCYVQDQDSILMLHRNKLDSHHSKQSYRALGGKVEQGENPFQSVIREVKEESGLDIEPQWKGIVTFSTKSEKNDWEAHVFTANKLKGDLINSPEGKLIWVKKERLAELEMPEGDKKLIPFLFNNKPFHIHLVYDNNGKLLNFNAKELLSVNTS